MSAASKAGQQLVSMQAGCAAHFGFSLCRNAFLRLMSRSFTTLSDSLLRSLTVEDCICALTVN